MRERAKNKNRSESRSELAQSSSPKPHPGARGQKKAAPPGHLPEGRFSYDGLERAIHEKARLGILTSLVAQPRGLSFNDLKELCALTDGNLNRHLAVLEEVGLVETHRDAQRGRPQTRVVLTPSGRRRFQQYLNVLEQVIADAAEAQRQAAASGAIDPRLGWSTA